MYAPAPPTAHPGALVLALCKCARMGNTRSHMLVLASCKRARMGSTHTHMRVLALCNLARMDGKHADKCWCWPCAIVRVWMGSTRAHTHALVP